MKQKKKKMMHKFQRLAAFVVIFISILHIRAQEGESRPVTGLYAIEIGHEEVLATYLSPLKYSGTTLGVSGEWSKAMPFNPEKAIMTFDMEGHFSNLLNPAQTARMIGLNGLFSWGMSWREKLPQDFQVTAGGSASIKGGAYYLLRNSNNPVQAMANASINITASASKHIKIGKLPILFEDRVTIPTLGVFFAPGYGETYYEIYLGNHKDLAHFGWWGNNFQIDNLLSISLDFGRTAMTLGYRFVANTQWANNLNTKIYSNSFVIGVIPGGLGLKRKTTVLPETKIYSLY